MTALVLTPQPPLATLDPMKDKSYEHTALGPAVVAWLGWMELGGTMPRTLDQYERDLSRLALAYPAKALGDLTDSDISHVIRSWGPKSRRVRMAAISSFFRWARRTRRIDSNPMEFLPSIKRGAQPYIETFTAAECEALVSLPEPDGALAMILLDAGLRKSEARHLQVRHAQPETGRLIVIEGKGGKDRVIPMTGRLKQALATLYTLDGLGRDDYLWYDRPGGGPHIRRRWPIGDGSFDRWWRRSVKTAGVRYRKPHTTRHTCATSWRRRGLALDDVQALLGHASIATTEALYVHSTADDVAARMLALEEAEL